MTTQDKVIRVEMKSGQGVFRAGVVPTSICVKMLGPWNDGINIHKHDYIFGFHNMDHLIYYFFDEMVEFINWILATNHDIDDVGIAEYECVDIIKGKTQCIFKPAKKLSWTPLSEFYS